jgi:hypothetical protein
VSYLPDRIYLSDWMRVRQLDIAFSRTFIDNFDAPKKPTAMMSQAGNKRRRIS